MYVLDTGSAYSDRASTRIPGQPVFTLEPGFGGKRQTDAYIGVCSTDPKKFTKWALANLGYELRGPRCQNCPPRSLGLTG